MNATPTSRAGWHLLCLDHGPKMVFFKYKHAFHRYKKGPRHTSRRGRNFTYSGASSATRWLRVTMPCCSRMLSAASLSSTRKTTQALPWERVMKA